jgi:hypothetical protein
LSGLSTGNRAANPEHGRVVETEHETEHHCDAVEEVEGGYVLVCTCGWRSTADPSAATVGDLWDRHRGIAG